MCQGQLCMQCGQYKHALSGLSPEVEARCPANPLTARASLPVQKGGLDGGLLKLRPSPTLTESSIMADGRMQDGCGRLTNVHPHTYLCMTELI